MSEPNLQNIPIRTEEGKRIRQQLFVDGTRNKPFHCHLCGDTYEPCAHWAEEGEGKDQ